MTLPLSRPSYRADIDGLRALAVLGVVVFHAFPFLVPGGFVGVDVFFVISGFLISTLLFEGMDRGGFSIIDFYDRRIRRIFPALIVVMAAALAFGWFALLDSEYKRLGKHIFAGAVFISNFALWDESGYFDVDSLTKPMLHLWSLAVEEQFYVVWPLFLLLVARLRQNFMRITIILAALSLFLNVVLVWKYQSTSFYMPFTRFWELMAGGMLAHINLYNRARFNAWIAAKIKPYQPQHILSVAGVLLIALAMIVKTDEAHFPGLWVILPVAGALCLIAAGRDGLINRHILASRAAVWVGLISYPLYLWHWPLLSFLRIVESGTAPVLYRGIAVALSFALAYGTYVLVEKPIRQRKLRHAALILLGLMIAVGGAGLYVRKHDGFPGRPMPVPEAQLASFKWDHSRNKDPACVTNFAIKDPLLAYCLSTDNTKAPDIAVIGDSHSNQVYWALRGYYSDPGETVVNIGGPGGCMPFYDGEKLTDICDSLMHEVLDLVLRTDSIKTVYLGARASYILKTDLFREVLEKTLRRFADAGKTMVIVLDTPEMGFDPKICMDTRRFKISEPDPMAVCRVARQKIDKDQKNYREAAFAAARSYSNVRFLDLPALLCDADYCRGIKDGRILYRDSNHLSVWGTEYLGKRIESSPAH